MKELKEAKDLYLHLASEICKLTGKSLNISEMGILIWKRGNIKVKVLDDYKILLSVLISHYSSMFPFVSQPQACEL